MLLICFETLHSLYNLHLKLAQNYQEYLNIFKKRKEK